MFDELLHQKEIQLEDAKRKLAWYMEEYREIEPSPILKEYHYLESKPRAEFTPAETARLEELSKLQEPFQFYRNEFNRLRAGRELAAAESDLEAYKKIINLAENPASVLIDKKTPDAICDAATAAASDNDTSAVAKEGSSESSNREKDQLDFRDFSGTEVRRRRRADKDGGKECGEYK